MPLKYIELKSGYSDNGPAWIARVEQSKSGQTIYFNGCALKKAQRGQFIDIQSGQSYWISGVKKNGGDRHWAGSGKILIEAAALQEFLTHTGLSAIDKSRFHITHDIVPTDKTVFTEFENASS